ncbi:MAG: hypothetical protein JSS49_22395 [Planctomycetes bacterium]|nr:hypothetical protein [Planctomycetota bacterium]
MVNVDVDEGVSPDIHLDFIVACRRFPTGSVAHVEMCHSLGYVRLWEARELFAEVYRILCEKGTFVIELPDIGKCAAEMINTSGRDFDQYLEAVRGCYAFDIEQIAKKVQYHPYLFGWSAWHLLRELRLAGFTDAVEGPPRTHGPRFWRDVRVECTK